MCCKPTAQHNSTISILINEKRMENYYWFIYSRPLSHLSMSRCSPTVLSSINMLWIFASETSGSSVPPDWRWSCWSSCPSGWSLQEWWHGRYRGQEWDRSPLLYWSHQSDDADGDRVWECGLLAQPLPHPDHGDLHCPASIDHSSHSGGGNS